MLQGSKYFSGKVRSAGFPSNSISHTSVGVMVKSEYIFSTAEPEETTVINGVLDMLLPDTTNWQVYEADSVSNIPGHNEFHLQVAKPISYLYRYL